MVLSCLVAALSRRRHAEPESILEYQLALNAAAASGDTNGVGDILRSCQNPNLSLQEAFVSALNRGILHLVQVLAFDARLDLGRVHALHLAAVSGHLAIVDFLRRLDDQLSVSPWTIRDSGFYRHYHVVDYLLSCTDADPAALDSYCLRQAAANDDTRLVQILLRDGRSNPNAMNGSALRLASSFGYEGVVKALLSDTRTDASLADSEALRSAAEFGHETIVNMLLEKDGVEVNACDSDALIKAAGNGHAAIVTTLIASGSSCTADALRSAIKRADHRVLNVLVGHYQGDRCLLKEARHLLDRARKAEILSILMASKTDLLQLFPIGLQAVILQMAFGGLMEDRLEICLILKRVTTRPAVASNVAATVNR